MKSQSSGIRVEQWTAASAQAHIPAPADHACDDGEKCVPSIPSLLETLRAAAAAAAEKANARPSNLGETLPSELQKAAAEACQHLNPESQLSDNTQFANELTSSRSGIFNGVPASKPFLQALAVKKSMSRPQKGASMPESPSTPCSLNASVRQRFIHKARAELRVLEENIPWEAVQESWKDRRQSWRKTLRQTEAVSEVLALMNELRKALAIENSPFSAFGGPWDQTMQKALDGNAAGEDLLQLLNELRQNARQWTKSKPREPRETVISMEWSKEQKAVALQALEALWRASLRGPSGLMQCPLEAILDYDQDATRFLRQLLGKEMTLLANTAQGKETSRLPSASIFTSLQQKQHGNNGIQWPGPLLSTNSVDGM